MNNIKAKILGLLGTIIFCLCTFLILWFVVLPVDAQPSIADDEIMVSFGDNMDGSGFGSEGGGNVQPEISDVQPVNEEQTSTQENITEDNDKDAEPIIKKKPVEKKPATPIVRKSPKKPDVKPKTDPSVAESNKKQTVINHTNNLVGNAFGNGSGEGKGSGTGKGNGNGSGEGTGNGKGSGNTFGDTFQGNPAGLGRSGGNSWSLNGRSLVGTLATPSYTSNVEGKVTVSIRVDANGKVTSASVSSPTTISDAQTRNEALSAARSTRFSGGSGVSVGTITYNFKLR